MSTDLIRFALANYTDWAKFENLATEMMRDRGYADIKPLGGQKDGGKDAVVERYYSHTGKRVRTVFQFTLRKDVLTKISETIKTLIASKEDFAKLIIVTSSSLSVERQEEARRLAQKDYEVDLEIYENRALIAYLSDSRNTVFVRYFPDIRKQAEVLLSSAESQQKSSAAAREREFLKICCAFSFTPTARKTRKSLIDQAVLGLVSLAHGTPVSSGQILASAETTFGHGVFADENQVSAAISRLIGAGWIDSSAGGFSLSTVGKLFVAGAEEETKADRDAAIGDIIADVIQALGEPISDEEQQQLEANARTVLLEYFRLNGLELANSILTNQPPILVYGQATERLKEMACYHLPEHLGMILFDAVGSSLSNPTDEQAKYFAGCSRAYLASQVLNIDPALRDFQATRIAKKIFVLDTDFVLDTLIQDLPKSSVNRNLVNRLLSLGAKVLVPEEVLREVTTHLKISISTFDNNEDYLNSISEDLLTSQVQNALVKGYWYSARGRGCYRADFLKYRNSYYDDEIGEAFVAELAKDTLPSVSIGTTASELGVEIDSSRYEAIKEVMLEFSQATGKGLYRTEAQNIRVAETDALLMLAVFQHNESSDSTTKSILHNNAHIITSSGRYIRAAQSLKLAVLVSTRPHILAGLLELFSPSGIDDRHFVSLFENPIIQQSAQRCWSDIKVLLDAGIELRGVSLTRLRYDVEKALSGRISAIKDIVEDEDAKLDKQIELVEAAEEKGYLPNPVVATLMARGTSAEEDLTRLAGENEALRDAVKNFGQKKERWLRRFDRMRGKK